MKSTIFLNTQTWDLDVDAFRNIAMAEAPYAQAQDVACICRLWKGEARYNVNRGIPYKDRVLGQTPPPRLLVGWFETEAKTVPGVVTPTAILQHSRASRELGGQIQLTLENGESVNVNF